MKLTYWIAEHKGEAKHQTLRFGTKEEFDRFVKDNELTIYVRDYYHLPREIKIPEGMEMIDVIKACINKESYELLPWEK